ncbi:MCE family protein [Mycolicibacterium gilvum]|uniref:Virulence factor Mce family protein n=1 Tax=Mycolicibacterium gilvum TaxID=1804 RepID=A0A378SJJ1_9MYCO|nr:MCE family protein [Mycolicibacterium gilvum]MCV7055149.1 MCE family protein [Mycolicibacterium gilvum]STZ42870.1 virulence factor Mce family protein [Mycolicibacterium gilvum]
MLKYRRASTVRAGFIGVVLIVLVIAVGLAPERITGWAKAIRYQAVFADLSGLSVGNDVTVSGMTLGKVTAVQLQDPNALVTFTVDDTTPLGSQSTAHIRTGTLLGQRVLTVQSEGDGSMSAMDIIPLTRTSSPYTLTEALGDLTTNSTGTDTAALNEALNTLSDTIDQISPQLGPTFDGLARISEALNTRNTALRRLFGSGRDVTAVLAERSEEVSALILNADDLVAMLAERRHTIVELLAHTSAVARGVTGLVHDNEQQLAPTLEKLNTVLAMLERQRDNIALALPRLAKYQVTLGETVASGPYYSAYIPNLDLPPILQPFLDYAFGFRRGVDAGQPPDDTGPRAELPFPRNGIPERPPR